MHCMAGVYIPLRLPLITKPWLKGRGHGGLSLSLRRLGQVLTVQGETSSTFIAISSTATHPPTSLWGVLSGKVRPNEHRTGLRGVQTLGRETTPHALLVGPYIVCPGVLTKPRMTTTTFHTKTAKQLFPPTSLWGVLSNEARPKFTVLDLEVLGLPSQTTHRHT